MIYDFSSSIKDFCNSIQEMLTATKTILPVSVKCNKCGRHFTVSSPVGILICPHCGSINV
jgi:Zn finger protein HypA/HybF involved in hydrogenase expression